VAWIVHHNPHAEGVNVIPFKVFHVHVVVEKTQVNHDHAGGVYDSVHVTNARLSSVIGSVIFVKAENAKFQVELGVHMVGAVFTAKGKLTARVILNAFQAASVQTSVRFVDATLGVKKLKITFQAQSMVGTESVHQLLEVNEVIVPPIILSFKANFKLLYCVFFVLGVTQTKDIVVAATLSKVIESEVATL